ncbi:preprotein translocase subunit SecG [Anaerolentibacter hominis]|uniref:preprotein translocase subunit SecG n=1 Tax=Anaerolentibacter hominis TaxID=3079009 RepID=UPI0031B82E8B
MAALKVVLTMIYVVVSIALVIIVLMQEGKSEGLSAALSGAGSGGNNSYWEKNKGRSKEGTMSKVTAILGTVFVVLSIVLNLNF